MKHRMHFDPYRIKHPNQHREEVLGEARRAVSIAAARYPGADVQVSFPIDADAFFIEKPGTRAEPPRREQPDRAAA
jgi:hypothetical protein